MCGRFAFFLNQKEPFEPLGIQTPILPFESYNIVPSQEILALRIWPETGQQEWATFIWGLVPFWCKTSKTKFPLINARAEGIEKKASFRGPFKYRRCIIPANGFYEWKGDAGGKQPYFIRPLDGTYFGFAGLWDHWQGMGMEEIESCAIITTNANELVSDIHDRMPVILNEKAMANWLDLNTGQSDLLAMLEPYPSEKMEAYPVSRLVNNARNNGPECIERMGQQQSLF